MLSVEYPLSRASVRPRQPHDPLVCDERALSTAAAALDVVKRRVPIVRAAVGATLWDRVVDTQHAGTRMAGCSAGRPVSRAYHKLHEMFQSCSLPSPTTSIHLCEAPGGFVQATAEAATGAWTWTAVSLVDGPQFAPQLPNASGRAVYADVYDDVALAALPVAGACLVTADGAVAMDHDALEAAHLPLLVRQTEVALRCLRPGGTLIVKFFEGCTAPTVRWAGWVASHFETTSVIKPTSSRPTNSERYLVARHLATTPSLPYEDAVVAPAWCAEFARVADRLASEQAAALQRTLDRVAQFRAPE